MELLFLSLILQDNVKHNIFAFELLQFSFLFKVFSLSIDSHKLFKQLKDLLLRLLDLLLDKLCGALHFLLGLGSDCDHDARRLIRTDVAQNIKLLPDLIAESLKK
jgi:hypothetical protein